jgi:pectate lyase
MKKTLTLIMGLMLLVPLQAVKYCAESSWGYAGNNVTGGGNATPTLVSTYDELKNALKNNKVVIITQDITVTTPIYIDGKTNITLMALPGKKLVNPTRTKAGSGILQIRNSSSNIILRNLTFEGPGAYDCNGRDNLTITGSQNIWVDHCDFQDGMDGNFDINSLSDNITVTWCRFRYFIDPIPAGEGGDSDDHRFSNLVGSSSEDQPTDGKYNITYGFCWWDEGCKQRMTRCRNAELHFLNCYWNSSVADYYVGPENAKCYFEGCTFAGKANKPGGIWSPFNGSSNACKFVHCSGNLPSNSGSVSAPSYTYDQLTAADAKKYVTNSTCGAGATLEVTTAGAVSSSCPDEGGSGGTDPDPLPGTITWDISDDAFSSLSTLSSETTVKNLHMVASSDKTITFTDIPACTIDDNEFTRRLNLGGAGNSTARHLWFNVTGNCTISVYLASSSTDTRTMNIDKGSFGTNIAFLSAASSASKQTYTYSGGATKIYLYSTNKNIYVYGIDVAYSATGIETAQTKNAVQKVLRNGQILILRDGKTYNVLGLNQ